MKFPIAVVAALSVPLVATFAPPLSHSRRFTNGPLAAENVPEIVKAYGKAGKPGNAFADISIGSSAPPPVEAVKPMETPVDIPATPVELPKVDFSKVSMSKVEFPKVDLPKVDLPQAPKTDFSALSSSVKSTIAASDELIKPLNGVSQGMNQILLNAKQAIDQKPVTTSAGSAPTFVDWVQNELSGDLKVQLPALAKNFGDLFSNPEAAKAQLAVVPPEKAALAVGSVVLIAALGKVNENSYKVVNATEVEMAEKEAAAVEEVEEVPVADLVKGVDSMTDQIQYLTDEINKQRQELKEASKKLVEKELEISKEKLKVADNELRLNRQVQDLTQKLRVSEQKNRKMESQMAKSSVKKDEPVKKVEAPAPKAKAKSPAPKKAAAKKPAPKAKAAPKKAEPFFAAEAEVKPAAKKVAKAKKAAKGKSTVDLKSLTDSALSRKTVKDLKQYLDAKGVKTTGDDGKPLKKALLIEAVRSL